MIKVRFAPSPTGNLHIGSARTALFNYLFAKHHGGKFVLRVEDTDVERSKKEFEEDILSGLAWLGYQHDEPLVYQAQRKDIHQKYIDQLLSKGLAYHHEGAVFFKVPTEGETIIEDVVKGNISFQNKDFKDQVILKSDGSVTYNFAVVIDDAEMGITHVIRGEDHISNTPKQIFFYQALSFELPKFAHIPMILGPDRSKLSKRHGATSINEYRRQGYLPEAINNYLSLLGWTPADGQEIMTMAEIITRFDLDRVSSSNSIFDVEKLNWLNKQKIKLLPGADLLPYFPNEYLSTIDKSLALQILEVVKDSLTLLADVPNHVKVFFTDIQTKETFSDNHKRVFSLFSGKISDIFASNDYSEMFSAAQLTIDQILAETGFKKGDVLHPLRVALTGETKGPALKFMIALLGQEKVKQRIEHALRG